jgi:hypothetical protein
MLFLWHTAAAQACSRAALVSALGAGGGGVLRGAAAQGAGAMGLGGHQWAGALRDLRHALSTFLLLVMTI